MQQEILQNVSVIQGRTAQLVKQQENDLARAFRARLMDVQTGVARPTHHSYRGSPGPSPGRNSLRVA